jgi:hypothetical protein
VDGLTVPPAGTRRWPFGLGLITYPDTPDAPTGPTPPDHAPDVGSPGWDAATSQHLAVALAAYRAGYFLLHTLRASRPPTSTGRHGGGHGTAARSVIGERDRARLWALALRTDADGLFVLGLDPDALTLLEPLATELRLTVHTVPPAAGMVALAAESGPAR